jgi:hypothetical protein
MRLPGCDLCERLAVAMAFGEHAMPKALGFCKVAALGGQNSHVLRSEAVAI